MTRRHETARAVASLAASAMIAACSLPEPVETDLAASGAEVRARWSTTTGPAPVRTGWIADLEDPALARLVDEAIGVSFDLRAAAARMRAAGARARIAGAAQRPRLDAEVAGARRGTPAALGRRSTGNDFDVTLDAEWEVDVWNRLANETRAEALDADAAAADLAAARLSLAANVARGWFDTVEAELQVALAEETVATFRDNLAVVEEGFRRGLNSALDVRLERSNLAQAESELAGRRVERDAAVRTLEVLLGRYPAAELDVADELPGLTAGVPAGIPAEVLARRPDLRAAALRLRARDERLNAALKNRLPRIVLTGAGGLTSSELRDLLDFDALLWSIATDVAAPLLRGGELDAERDLARADVEELLADYAGAVLTAFREVESALTAEDLLARREEALRVAAREAAEAETLALERYRSGLVDIVTFLEARRRAFDARSALIAVSNRRLQNRIALHLALGGDFAERETVARAVAESSP